MFSSFLEKKISDHGLQFQHQHSTARLRLSQIRISFLSALTSDRDIGIDFMINDVVGLDLSFSNTYAKHMLPAMNIVCWSTGLQRVINVQGSVGRNLEERTQKHLVAVIRKASHPCCRPAAQPVLRHFRGKCKVVGRDSK